MTSTNVKTVFILEKMEIDFEEFKKIYTKYLYDFDDSNPNYSNLRWTHNNTYINNIPEDELGNLPLFEDKNLIWKTEFEEKEDNKYVVNASVSFYETIQNKEPILDYLNNLAARIDFLQKQNNTKYTIYITPDTNKFVVIKDYSQSGGKSSKADYKSTGEKIKFVVDGKQVSRVVHVNKRGTKYVSYDKKWMRVSNLKK